MAQPTSDGSFYTEFFSGLGALGVALQNYQAVELFINGFIQPGYYSSLFAQTFAFSTGAVCSGLVNYWMIIKPLKGFFKRMSDQDDTRLPPWKQIEGLEFWQKIQYVIGIFIFVVTGILFGLMAFAFASEGSLALFSIVVGLFVSGIMTIQEVETWLRIYDPSEASSQEQLTEAQQWGHWLGHVIAIGNVIALSLLFTLGLTQALMFLNVAALPALCIGFAVAFSFGAFTEYFFYDFYLSDFCKDIDKKWLAMMASPQAYLGLLCVSINAFVNTALTYAGLELLAALIISAGLTLPPVGLLIAMMVAASAFAGSASFILGMDFWIDTQPPGPNPTPEGGPSSQNDVLEHRGLCGIA